MTSRQCPELDRFLNRLEAGEVEDDDRVWQAHRERCASCRRHWAADREMRSWFAEVPRPRLSASFNRRLEQRLELEASHPAPKTARRFVLPAYWLAACLASFFILGRIGGAAGTTPWPWVSAIALVPLALSPLAALARRLGLDFFELVFMPAE